MTTRLTFVALRRPSPTCSINRTGLKRPDLDATVDGNKIASETQRQLYDDIKRGNCTRCHKGGHIQKTG